jgi:hypothetical protein
MVPGSPSASGVTEKTFAVTVLNHMPVADAECWIMLVENAGTRNTGEAVTARTKTDLPAL